MDVSTRLKLSLLGEGEELSTCLYPPRDQRSALRSRVSGRRVKDGWGSLEF